jgi:hypothetical protein
LGQESRILYLWNNDLAASSYYRNKFKMTKIKKTTYDFKKTLAKFGIALVQVLVAGLIVYATERPEFLLVIPLLEALRNWLKHRNK